MRQPRWGDLRLGGRCGGQEKSQSVCKPGSVSGFPPDDHSSGAAVAGRLVQPTRTTGPETGWAFARVIPIRSCSRWGLPCRSRCRSRGGLLHHLFTLTPARRGGSISVALSLRSPSPGVTRHRVSVEPGLSSRTGFRHLSARSSNRLAGAVWHAPAGRSRCEQSPQAISLLLSASVAGGPPALGSRASRGRRLAPEAARGGFRARRRRWSRPSNRRARCGSCASRHGRHCSGEWCRRYRRRPACRLRPNRPCPT